MLFENQELWVTPLRTSLHKYILYLADFHPVSFNLEFRLDSNIPILEYYLTVDKAR